MTIKPTSTELQQIIRRLEEESIQGMKAGESLHESEKKYKFLTDNMKDILWIMDMDLRTTYVTPSIETVLGFSQEERLRQSVNEQLTPDSLRIAIEALSREMALEKQDCADPGRTLTLALEFYHKDGSTRWLETIVSGIRDDHGVLTRLYGVSRDITMRKQAEDALRESEERFRQISHLTTDITYSCLANEDGVFSVDWMSGNAEAMTGYTIDEIKAQTCWRFLVTEEDTPLFEEHVIGLSPGQSASVDLHIRHRNGGILCVTSYAEAGEDAKTPGCRRLYGGLVDITDRKRTEEALKKSEEQYRLLIEALPLGVFVHTRDKIVYVNPAFLTLFKASSADGAVGKRLIEFVPPEFFDHIKERSRVMIEEQRILPPLEIKLRCLDGIVITVVSTSIPIIFQEQPAILTALYDVTERKRGEIELQKANKLLQIHSREIEALQVRLKEQAIRDSLTGLFNRRYLEETLVRELAKASREGFPLGIIMIDIDHFKQVNDTYGHKAGDLVLQALGNLLHAGIRAGDIACRYGGEEFLLILPRASKAKTGERAEQWRAAFEALRTVYGEKAVHATISLGVATYPADGVTAEALIHAADQAMYRAKALGRNRVVLSSPPKESSSDNT